MIVGDIRLNLDPLQQHKDSELWHVLGQVELTDVVTAAGGLSASVSEDGANWSQGQYVP
jgi:ABC-type transport system involved in cytochrome bd biosynthesis fused ATPase/permease subunit